MHRYSTLCLSVLIYGAALSVTLFFAPPARADQIVLTVDEHGHKIFINTSEPAERPAGWLSGLSRNRTATFPSPTPEINHLVDQTAKQFEVDPQLVHAIIRTESEYNPKAVSRKGAMGLMQLIPGTAARFGVNNPFDPKQNIEGGISYLKYLLDLFGGDLALSLAAYNSGEHAVERYGGIPAFPETRHYVRKVWDLYQPGEALNPAQGLKEPARPPIYRYVDTRGVVHFTNVE